MNPHESKISETVEWFTPPEIFQAIGLEFEMDAVLAARWASLMGSRASVRDDGRGRDFGPLDGDRVVQPAIRPAAPRVLQAHGSAW